MPRESTERNIAPQKGAEIWEKQKSFPTKVSESGKTTFGEIALDLGIKTDWLKKQGVLNNPNVFSIDKKTLTGIKHEGYDW